MISSSVEHEPSLHSQEARRGPKSKLYRNLSLAAVAAVALGSQSGCKADDRAEAHLSAALRTRGVEVNLANILHRPVVLTVPNTHLNKGDFSRSQRGATNDMQVNNRRPVAIRVPDTEGGGIGFFPGFPLMPYSKPGHATARVVDVVIDGDFDPRKEKTLRIGINCTSIGAAAVGIRGVWVHDELGSDHKALNLVATVDRAQFPKDPKACDNGTPNMIAQVRTA